MRKTPPSTISVPYETHPRMSPSSSNTANYYDNQCTSLFGDPVPPPPDNFFEELDNDLYGSLRQRRSSSVRSNSIVNDFPKANSFSGRPDSNSANTNTRFGTTSRSRETSEDPPCARTYSSATRLSSISPAGDVRYAGEQVIVGSRFLPRSPSSRPSLVVSPPIQESTWNNNISNSNSRNQRRSSELSDDFQANLENFRNKSEIDTQPKRIFSSEPIRCRRQESNESFSSSEWFKPSNDYQEWPKIPRLRPSSKNVISINQENTHQGSPLASLIQDSNASTSSDEKNSPDTIKSKDFREDTPVVIISEDLSEDRMIQPIGLPPSGSATIKREVSLPILTSAISTGSEFRANPPRPHKKSSFTIIAERSPHSSRPTSPQQTNSGRVSPFLGRGFRESPRPLSSRQQLQPTSNFQLPNITDSNNNLNTSDDSARPSVQFNMSSFPSPALIQPPPKSILQHKSVKPMASEKHSPLQKQQQQHSKLPNVRSYEALPKIHKTSATLIRPPPSRLNKSSLDLFVEPKQILPLPIRNPNPTSHQRGLLRVYSSADNSPSRIPVRPSLNGSLDDVAMQRRRSSLSPIGKEQRTDSISTERRSSSLTMPRSSIASDRRSSNLSSVTTSDFSFRRNSISPTRSTANTLNVRSVKSSPRSPRRVAKPTSLSPIIGTPNKDTQESADETFSSFANSRRSSQSKIPIRGDASRTPSRSNSRVNSRSNSRVASAVNSRSASPNKDLQPFSRPNSRVTSRPTSRTSIRTDSRVPSRIPSRSNSRLSIREKSQIKAGSLSPPKSRKTSPAKKSRSASPRKSPRRSSSPRKSPSPPRSGNFRRMSRQKSPPARSPGPRSPGPRSPGPRSPAARSHGTRSPASKSPSTRSKQKSPIRTKVATMKSRIPSRKDPVSAKKASSNLKKPDPNVRRTPSYPKKEGNFKKETSNLSRTPSNLRREMSNLKPPSNFKRESSNLRRETSNLRRETSNLKREGSNLKRESSNLKREGSNLRRETSSMKREGSNLKREKSNLSNLKRDGSKREGSTLKKEGSNLKRVPSNLKREPTKLKREPSNVKGERSSMKKVGANLKREGSNVKMEPNLKKTPSNPKMEAGGKTKTEPSNLNKKRSDNNLGKKLEKKSSFRGEKAAAAAAANESDASTIPADSIKQDGGGAEVSTNDILIPLTKANVVSMTTAAITAQPVQITTTVTNQMTKTNSSGQLMGSDSTMSKEDAKDMRPATILEKSQKTLENVQKTVTEATEEIQKTINENLTDLKTLESDIGRMSDELSAPFEKSDSVTTIVEKPPKDNKSSTNPSSATPGDSNQPPKSPVPPTQPIEADVSVLHTKKSSDNLLHPNANHNNNNNGSSTSSTNNGIVDDSEDMAERSYDLSGEGHNNGHSTGTADASNMEKNLGAGNDDATDRNAGDKGATGGGDNMRSESQEYLDDEKPKGCCGRFCSKICMPCRRCQCCACCRRKQTDSSKSDEQTIVEEINEKQSCWKRCCSRNKSKDGAMESQMEEKRMATIQEERESEVSNSMKKQNKCCLCLGKVFCCRKTNKVESTVEDAEEVKKCCFCIPCRKKTKETNAWQERRESIISDPPPRAGCCSRMMEKLMCCRKPKPPSESRRPSMISKKQSIAPTIPLEDSRPKLHNDLVAYNSKMKGAIPVMPLWIAWFCMICNALVPGLGTILSGFFCLCVGIPRFSQYDSAAARFGSFIINWIVGIAQAFCVLFCFVGWGWSIWWGTIMLKTARKLKKIRRVEELELQEEQRQAAAEKARNEKDVEAGQK